MAIPGEIVVHGTAHAVSHNTSVGREQGARAESDSVACEGNEKLSSRNDCTRESVCYWSDVEARSVSSADRGSYCSRCHRVFQCGVCGRFSVKVMTELRSKHAPCSADSVKYGVDGETGAIIDVVQEQIWDSLAVKQQIFKTAIEAVSYLLSYVFARCVLFLRFGVECQEKIGLSYFVKVHH